MFSWEPLLLTFKLASITTIILLIIGIPLSYWFSEIKSKFKIILEAFVSMPLVLPPSVLGFYLLVTFGNNSTVGKFLNKFFDIQLVFTFEGLIIASVIFSLPFMIHPLQSGFENVNNSIKEAAYTLGKSKLNIVFNILLPNIKHSLLRGAILSFAHTIGEFGVVLMIGGNIPGETRVASIAIYDEVESLNYDTANMYAFVLFVISFSILILVHYLDKKLIKAF